MYNAMKYISNRRWLWLSKGKEEAGISAQKECAYAEELKAIIIIILFFFKLNK